MPSIAIQAAFITVTAADAVGNLTVSNNAYLFPGAKAWLTKDDGSLSYRILILAVSGTTGVIARRYGQVRSLDSGLLVDSENATPSYGVGNFSAFNAVACHINQESQTAPVDPAYAKRVVP